MNYAPILTGGTHPPGRGLVARSRPRSGSPGRSTPSTRTWSRPSTTECLTRSLTWTASPCWRGGPGASRDLPGGLTNHNVRVTSTDDGPPLDIVVRCSQSDASLLGIDRDHEHLNSTAAAAAGVAPPVVEYRPDLRMLAIGFLEGKALDNADFADPGVLARAADACRRLHAGPPFAGDFDMFERQATYRATVESLGARLPPDYDDHADAWEQVRRALAARPAPTVPCNNDLLAANFIDDGQRVWLIDYEYSGNNDACFELGNTSTECDFTARADRSVGRGLLRQPYPRRPGAGPARSPVQRVRLVALGLHPGRVEPARLRLPGLGDGALREGRGHVRWTWPSPRCWRMPPRDRSPLARSGRDRRWRHHRLLGGLPPDQARLDRRAAARAGTSLGRHHLARGRPGRTAAGLGERHPAGAVLRRALRGARGRDRAGHRLQERRWRRRGAHRGPDDPAQAHRGQRDGVRHGVRADQPRARPGAVAADAGRRPARRAVAPRRREGEPDRRHPVAGEGCPDGRRHHRREGARARHRGARNRRRGHRRTHRPGGRRDRDRGQLRRPVGQGARRPGRRHGAAALRRALLRRHRGDRGRAP